MEPISHLTWLCIFMALGGVIAVWSGVGVEKRIAQTRAKCDDRVRRQKRAMDRLNTTGS